MNSSFNSSDNTTDIFITLTDNAYYYIAAYLIFLSIAGTFLNGAVIFAFIRFKTVQTNANRFVVAICICGLFISTLGIPFAAASAISHTWLFGSFGCKLHGFVLTGLGISMIAIFTAIAFDRYIAVVKFSANWKLKTHEVTALIALCFTYGGVLALFPLLDWSSYTEEIAHISCSIDWNERSLSSITYSITLMIGGLLAPLIVIVTLYMQVISLVSDSIFDLHEGLILIFHSRN
ncbi:hypothetical protein FSP39_013592 [Pinctada imbricata]|uniref:G-protein coupled receptors family 1 profile domain-containing protein n=1 Tax=Pinctada imbricata TaxID=66713 RepID=A0AA89BVM1_PINIB|nr:hypothetical protein FSP39_013592 [Pinctada imbricata]